MIKGKYFLSWKKRVEVENIEYIILNNVANIKNHHPHVHSINIDSSLFLTLCKWGETSSTTSLLLIRTSNTSGFRNGSVFTSSVVFFAQLRSDSGIIPCSLQHGRVIVVVTSPD